MSETSDSRPTATEGFLSALRRGHVKVPVLVVAGLSQLHWSAPPGELRPLVHNQLLGDSSEKVMLGASTSL
jgi:hypothetical protein